MSYSFSNCQLNAKTVFKWATTLSLMTLIYYYHHVRRFIIPAIESVLLITQELSEYKFEKYQFTEYFSFQASLLYNCIVIQKCILFWYCPTKPQSHAMWLWCKTLKQKCGDIWARTRVDLIAVLWKDKREVYSLTCTSHQQNKLL